MNTPWTPGPWEYEAEAGIGVYVHDTEGTVAEIMCDQKLIDDRTAIANARLIAAAPELYEALADMLAGWRYIRETHGDLYGVGWDRAEDKANAALARARGES